MTVVTTTATSLVGDDEEPRAGFRAPLLTSADLAECNCPDPCERDHDLD